jgi:hypothetical protein
MSYMINMLETKADIDHAIRSTRDKVLSLTFIRTNDNSCLKLIDIVSTKN